MKFDSAINRDWISIHLSTYENPQVRVLTGVKEIKCIGEYLTVKITPKEEATAAGPTSVLVLPEHAVGNYDLVVESSSDMVTRSSFHSQAVQSDAPSKMFRVRIVKK
jgi:hypothetical protein